MNKVAQRPGQVGPNLDLLGLKGPKTLVCIHARDIRAPSMPWCDLRFNLCRPVKVSWIGSRSGGRGPGDPSDVLTDPRRQRTSRRGRRDRLLTDQRADPLGHNQLKQIQIKYGFFCSGGLKPQGAGRTGPDRTDPMVLKERRNNRNKNVFIKV